MDELRLDKRSDKADTRPLAIIMRGLPGSGKSYWVEQFIQSQGLEQASHIRQYGYFTTDSYFYQQGKYQFQPNKLAHYHQANLTAFIEALARKEPIVICDNTNLAKWEFMAYQAAAKALGYQIKVVLVGDPLSSDHQQLCASRNQHCVSLNNINNMVKSFEA